MREVNIVDRIQILTGVAVLAGLVLVVWEMQQTKDLVRAQLLSDGFVADMGLSSMTLSESFASVRAKACSAPDELSDSELFEMYEYHAMLYNNIVRMRMLNDAGVFPEAWQVWATGYLKVILSTRAGQADIATFPVNSEIRELADELIASKEIYDCNEKMRLYYKRARDPNFLKDISGNPA